MSATSTYVQLTEMECGKCGVAFAIPESMRSEKERDGGNWFCPNGHSRVYRETVTEKLAKERARSARLVAERDQLDASLRATRGVVTRKTNELKRVKAGVCPCCNRSFQNLHRHMETKHPDFDPAA